MELKTEGPSEKTALILEIDKELAKGIELLECLQLSVQLPSAEGRVVILQSAWMTAHLNYGRRETLCPKTVTKGCPVDSDFLRTGLFISEENASQMVPLTLEK